MSSRKLSFAHVAERDLRDLLQFTADTCGPAHRDGYAKTLADGLEDLGRFPLLGRAHSDLGAELRSIVVGKHQVYYRVTETEVIVIRVAHEREDQPNVNRDV